MTPDDDLERELQSYRPRPPAPEMNRRIGRRIVQVRRRRLATAFAIAAAVVGVAVGLNLHRPSAPPGIPPMVPPAQAAVPPPTVLAYEQAFAQSPAALDALLDEQSVRASRGVSTAPPAHAGLVPNLLALKGSRE